MLNTSINLHTANVQHLPSKLDICVHTYTMCENIDNISIVIITINIIVIKLMTISIAIMIYYACV